MADRNTYHHCYIGIGSNLGDRKQNIRSALELLGNHPGVRVSRISSLLETAPMGLSDPAAPHFLNAAAALETNLSPRELLEVLKSIERKLGKQVLSSEQAAEERERRETSDSPYHSRPIDLDILLYEDWIVREPDLTIPHPRMWERDFVMKPLREIHPGL